MKRLIAHLPFLAGLALLASCAKQDFSSFEPAGKKNNIVYLTISANREDLTQTPDGTKLAYNPNGTNVFSFEAGDKLQLIIGTSPVNCITKLISIDEIGEGGTTATFKGTVDLGTYTANDILGAVIIRGNLKNNYGIGTYSSSTTIYFDVPSDQYQSAAGVFSDDTGRFFFYGAIKGNSAVSVTAPTEDSVLISGLTLKQRDPIWEFRIYSSTDRSDEMIQSIRISTSSETVDGAYVLACRRMITPNTGGHKGVNGPYYYTVNVNLQTPFAVPSSPSVDNAVWMTVYAGSEKAKKMGVVTITTDKAVYVRDFGGADSPKTNLGYINPININLDGLTGEERNFARKEKGSGLLYSIGTSIASGSGAEWQSTLPASSESFRTLSVAGSLTAAQLTAIKDTLANHYGKTTQTVFLDLSKTTYASTTFPAGVFGISSGTTQTNASKCLYGIKFPSNVTSLANYAFRYSVNLYEVDLKGIQTIGTTAFSNAKALVVLGDVSSLKTINANALYNGPSIMAGQYYFSNLETISGNGNYTFGGANCKWYRVYLPKIKTIGQNAFSKNGNLSVVDLGSSLTSIGASAFASCSNLKTIYCRATSVPTLNATDPFASVTGVTLFVPSSAKSSYETAFATYVTNSEWTIAAIPE